MRLVVPPGVFRPRSDSWMLANAVREHPRTPGGRVLDLCTGSGLVAVSAGLAGAASITALDVSRRSAATAWLNGRLNGVAVRGVRGELLSPVAGQRFDLIASNPPYIPAPPDGAASRAARAWDAGPDGRQLLDRICAEAPGLLAPGGALLLVHSSLARLDATTAACEAAGLEVEVLVRRRGALGPIAAARAQWLVDRGVLDGRDGDEEVAVVQATLEAQPATAAA